MKKLLLAVALLATTQSNAMFRAGLSRLGTVAQLAKNSSCGGVFKTTQPKAFFCSKISKKIQNISEELSTSLEKLTKENEQKDSLGSAAMELTLWGVRYSTYYTKEITALLLEENQELRKEIAKLKKQNSRFGHFKAK
jgi:H2-forming N5,N10-methylenetetrahydromethanopterin dehydrogenase-like enzyme